jgi:hypothetical protein
VHSLAAATAHIAQPNDVSFKPLTPELNPSAQRCLTIFLLGILLLEPCISLILYMREKPTNTPIIHSIYYVW